MGPPPGLYPNDTKLGRVPSLHRLGSLSKPAVVPSSAQHTTASTVGNPRPEQQQQAASAPHHLHHSQSAANATPSRAARQGMGHMTRAPQHPVANATTGSSGSTSSDMHRLSNTGASHLPAGFTLQSLEFTSHHVPRSSTSGAEPNSTTTTTASASHLARRALATHYVSHSQADHSAGHGSSQQPAAAGMQGIGAGPSSSSSLQRSHSRSMSGSSPVLLPVAQLGMPHAHAPAQLHTSLRSAQPLPLSTVPYSPRGMAPHSPRMEQPYAQPYSPRQLQADSSTSHVWLSPTKTTARNSSSGSAAVAAGLRHMPSHSRSNSFSSVGSFRRRAPVADNIQKLGPKGFVAHHFWKHYEKYRKAEIASLHMQELEAAAIAEAALRPKGVDYSTMDWGMLSASYEVHVNQTLINEQNRIAALPLRREDVMEATQTQYAQWLDRMQQRTHAAVVIQRWWRAWLDFRRVTWPDLYDKPLQPVDKEPVYVWSSSSSSEDGDMPAPLPAASRRHYPDRRPPANPSGFCTSALKPMNNSSGRVSKAGAGNGAKASMSGRASPTPRDAQPLIWKTAANPKVAATSRYMSAAPAPAPQHPAALPGLGSTVLRLKQEQPAASNSSNSSNFVEQTGGQAGISAPSLPNSSSAVLPDDDMQPLLPLPAVHRSTIGQQLGMAAPDEPWSAQQEGEAECSAGGVPWPHTQQAALQQRHAGQPVIGHLKFWGRLRNPKELHDSRFFAEGLGKVQVNMSDKELYQGALHIHAVSRVQRPSLEQQQGAAQALSTTHTSSTMSHTSWPSTHQHHEDVRVQQHQQGALQQRHEGLGAPPHRQQHQQQHQHQQQQVCHDQGSTSTVASTQGPVPLAGLSETPPRVWAQRSLDVPANSSRGRGLAPSSHTSHSYSCLGSNSTAQPWTMLPSNGGLTQPVCSGFSTAAQYGGLRPGTTAPEVARRRPSHMAQQQVLCPARPATSYPSQLQAQDMQGLLLVTRQHQAGSRPGGTFAQSAPAAAAASATGSQEGLVAAGQKGPAQRSTGVAPTAGTGHVPAEGQLTGQVAPGSGTALPQQVVTPFNASRAAGRGQQQGAYGCSSSTVPRGRTAGSVGGSPSQGARPVTSQHAGSGRLALHTVQAGGPTGQLPQTPARSEASAVWALPMPPSADPSTNSITGAIASARVTALSTPAEPLLAQADGQSSLRASAQLGPLASSGPSSGQLSMTVLRRHAEAVLQAGLVQSHSRDISPWSQSGDPSPGSFSRDLSPGSPGRNGCAAHAVASDRAGVRPGTCSTAVGRSGSPLRSRQRPRMQHGSTHALQPQSRGIHAATGGLPLGGVPAAVLPWGIVHRTQPPAGDGAATHASISWEAQQQQQQQQQAAGSSGALAVAEAPEARLSPGEVVVGTSFIRAVDGSGQRCDGSGARTAASGQGAGPQVGSGLPTGTLHSGSTIHPPAVRQPIWGRHEHSQGHAAACTDRLPVAVSAALAAGTPHVGPLHVLLEQSHLRSSVEVV